ncbi:MAG: hypothetical protein ACKPKO_13705, partial [Candidatus Fonsibacter sp.]
MIAFFKVSVAALGRCGEEWRSSGLVTADIGLDWSKGCFNTCWADDHTHVTVLRHVSGAEVDISAYSLTPDDDFGGNHSDTQAFMWKGRQELLALSFFPQNNPINALCTRAVLNNHADDVPRSVAEAHAIIKSAHASDKADVC